MWFGVGFSVFVGVCVVNDYILVDLGVFVTPNISVIG